jgi:hypothetical protein
MTHAKSINRSRSRRRARREFVFHVVKRFGDSAKVRYRRIYENTGRAFVVFALANLYLVQRRLLLPRAEYALYEDDNAPSEHRDNEKQAPRAPLGRSSTSKSHVIDIASLQSVVQSSHRLGKPVSQGPCRDGL